MKQTKMYIAFWESLGPLLSLGRPGKLSDIFYPNPFFHTSSMSIYFQKLWKEERSGIDFHIPRRSSSGKIQVTCLRSGVFF